MFSVLSRSAIAVAAGVALTLTVTMGSAYATPRTSTPSQASAVSRALATTTSFGHADVATRRIYLGRIEDNDYHNYHRRVHTGSYAIEYVASYGAVMNTYVDVTNPKIVPNQDGEYLGQVGVTYYEPVDTPTVQLATGRHQFTSQSAVITSGYVDVYLVHK